MRWRVRTGIRSTRSWSPYWVPVARTAAPGTPAQAAPADETTPAERHLPVPVVAAHGLLGAATLVLVLLAALGLGGS